VAERLITGEMGGSSATKTTRGGRGTKIKTQLNPLWKLSGERRKTPEKEPMWAKIEKQGWQKGAPNEISSRIKTDPQAGSSKKG